MADRSSWVSIRDRRMAEPAVRPAYDAARLAYELGRTVRQLREIRGWNETELTNAASMTQLVLARFEAGGAVPNLSALERLASALNADLVVKDGPARRRWRRIRVGNTGHLDVRVLVEIGPAKRLPAERYPSIGVVAVACRCRADRSVWPQNSKRRTP